MSLVVLNQQQQAGSASTSTPPATFTLSLFPSSLDTVGSVSVVCQRRMLNSSLLSSNSRHSPPNLQPNTLRPRWSLLRPPHLALQKVFFRLLFSTVTSSPPFFLHLQAQPQLFIVVCESIWFKGAGDGQFNSPQAVTCNSKGEIIVADCENHRFQVFDRNGKFLFKFGSEGMEMASLRNLVV